MITGIDIVIEARKMIGTPFKHQARVPGIKGGLDCVGLTVCIGRELGLEVKDRVDYARETDGQILLDSLQMHCEKSEEMQIGDIVQFLRGRTQWHVGVVSSLDPVPMMIHAKADIGGGGSVREDHMDAAWRRRIVGIWRYKGAA